MVTSAHVNVVMSDKALVKHLQRELTRLEDELRLADSTSSTVSVTETLLKAKDFQIKKVSFINIRFKRKIILCHN